MPRTERTIRTGRLSSIGTSAVQLISTTTGCNQGVTIKADANNAGVVYIGRSTVTANSADGTDGFPLAAGEEIFIPCEDVSYLYAIASTTAQKIFWIAY